MIASAVLFPLANRVAKVMFHSSVLYLFVHKCGVPVRNPVPPYRAFSLSVRAPAHSVQKPTPFCTGNALPRICSNLINLDLCIATFQFIQFISGMFTL